IVDDASVRDLGIEGIGQIPGDWHSVCVSERAADVRFACVRGERNDCDSNDDGEQRFLHSSSYFALAMRLRSSSIVIRDVLSAIGRRVLFCAGVSTSVIPEKSRLISFPTRFILPCFSPTTVRSLFFPRVVKRAAGSPVLESGRTA